MHRTSFSLFLFFVPLLLVSQQLSYERIIPIRSYDIREMGYPMRAVAAGEGRFAFLQYWPRDPYHEAENFYLQCLTTGGYEGEWFVPITEPGFEPMQVSDLYAVKDGLWVIGKQYLAKEKMVHTVGRFFDLEGKAATQEPVQVSNHGRRAGKNLTEQILLSPSQTSLLWMGTDGKQYFFSVWDNKGTQRWAKELVLPYTGESYALTEVAVNDEGNPTFLLQYEKQSFSLKDTAHPPLLVHYDAAADRFLKDTIHIDSAYAITLRLAQTGKETLAVVGVLGKLDGMGIANGAATGTDLRWWSHLLCRSYQAGDSLAVVADSVSELPGEWRERYKSEGSNFTTSRLFSENGTLVWVFEEAYVNKDRAYFYDLGCLAFDLKSGMLRWAESVEKRQRSQGSGAYLSYVAGLAKGKLQLLYLTELGAPGKVVCTSLDLRSGRSSDHLIISNENTQYLFLPRESGMVGEDSMVLLGIGHPDQNDFKLMTIRF